MCTHPHDGTTPGTLQASPLPSRADRPPPSGIAVHQEECERHRLGELGHRRKVVDHPLQHLSAIIISCLSRVELFEIEWRSKLFEIELSRIELFEIECSAKII